MRDADELVHRDDAGSVLDGERRGRERRDVGRQVPASTTRARGAWKRRPAQERREPAIAQVLGAPVEHDLTVRDEAGRARARSSRRPRLRSRAFVQSALRPVGLHPPAAQQRRGDAVERRRLVQAHEPVGVEPVASGAVTTVDDRDRHVGVGREGVDERHPHRPRADHQVVDVDDRLHALIRAVAMIGVNGPPRATPMRERGQERRRSGHAHRQWAGDRRRTSGDSAVCAPLPASSSRTPNPTGPSSSSWGWSRRSPSSCCGSSWHSADTSRFRSTCGGTTSWWRPSARSASSRRGCPRSSAA